MPHPDHFKYKIDRGEMPGLPHFSDFNEPRFASNCNKSKVGMTMYFQWLHCIGNWGEDHSMCKKARWYLERMMHEPMLEKWEERRALGHFDHTTQYGVRPYKEFVALYKPVKTVRKGAYEFWADRNFEPLYDVNATNWTEQAPILHELFVKGKKPVWDDKE